MTSFLIAVLLVLQVLPGDAEIGEEEEITEFLYDYASRFSEKFCLFSTVLCKFRDYLYATVEYYSENTTLIPTMYSYEEFQESVGSSLRCHLPLVVLLGLLRLLL